MTNTEWVIQIQNTKKPLDDMLIPISKRQGYFDGNPSVLPVYVCRYVGIGEHAMRADDIDLYYNNLYEFIESMKRMDIPYWLQEDHFFMPGNEEINPLLTSLNGVKLKDQGLDWERVMDHLENAKLLQVPNNSSLQVKQAMKTILLLFIEKEKNANASKIENFSVKLLVWFNRIKNTLFTSMQSHLPKVVFYGEAKPHEVYFLLFLGQLGVDVLYLHTNRQMDQVFFDIDPNQMYSRKLELFGDLQLQEFPKQNKLVRRSTVAYEASQQINEVLFSPEVGMFRPWQLQSNLTKIVTLKTTYDELKILWQQPSNMRPHFEVKNQQVYIPNLFAKVRGTQDDLGHYAQDIVQFFDADHTMVIQDIPYVINPLYSKQDMYKSAYLFQENGLLNREELVKSPIYNYHYLKESVQQLIMEKIDELIKSNIYLQPLGEKQRLQLLMTVMTMDAQFLQLLEVFDFTGKIPKVVFFTPKKTFFSEEDLLLLGFLYIAGLDILILTPTGYNNIEQGIKSSFFDIHELPSAQFDLDFSTIINTAKTEKAKGVLTGIFKRLFK